MNELDRIILDYVKVHPGENGRSIAKAIGVEKKKANCILYRLGPKVDGPLIQDELCRWYHKEIPSNIPVEKHSFVSISSSDMHKPDFVYRRKSTRTELDKFPDIYAVEPYNNQEDDTLRMLLTILGKEDHYDTVVSYCPRNIKAFWLFLRNKSMYAECNEFNIIATVILVCSIYLDNSSDLVTDTVFDEAVAHLVQRTSKFMNLSETRIQKLVKTIIDNANDLGEQLNNPFMALPIPKPSGYREISWDDVRFEEARIVIKSIQLKKRKTKPFIISDYCSSESLNFIKKYFYKVPKIEVLWEKERIKKIISRPDLNEYIIPLKTRIGKHVSKVDLKKLEMRLLANPLYICHEKASDALDEFVNKNKYFEWLALHQLEGYKPIIFDEQMAHMNSSKTFAGVAFSLKESDSNVIVVFENEVSKTCSLVFTIEKKNFSIEVEAIRVYLRSSTINKRDALSRRTDLPLENGNVIPYRRVSHVDFSSWKQNIMMNTYP